MAMLIFSLGATNFVPPSTWRGTMLMPAAAAAVVPRNFRRVRLDAGFDDSFIMLVCLWMNQHAQAFALVGAGVGCERPIGIIFGLIADSQVRARAFTPMVHGKQCLLRVMVVHLH